MPSSCPQVGTNEPPTSAEIKATFALYAKPGATTLNREEFLAVCQHLCRSALVDATPRRHPLVSGGPHRPGEIGFLNDHPTHNRLLYTAVCSLDLSILPFRNSTLAKNVTKHIITAFIVCPLIAAAAKIAVRKTVCRAAPAAERALPFVPDSLFLPLAVAAYETGSRVTRA